MKNPRWVAFLLVALGTSLVGAADAWPAFPGAEGFGATTAGGRGGRVIFVTNLDDSGAGSFRAACEAEGPRIVLFRVGGTIALKRPITVRAPYLTVAGQSAPGDGICLRDASLPARDAVDAHLVKHVRTRTGALIDSQRQVGGWPRLRAGTAPVDTDHDGMPDEWEKSRGLDPRGPADGAKAASSGGYTNLEVHLNELAARP